MSALMDQVYKSEAASHPSSVARPPAPFDQAPTGRLEASLVVIASLAIAGAVFGLALGRFGWTGLLLATWPALALAGGFGCFCHELLQRVRRSRPKATLPQAIPMSNPDSQPLL